MPKRINKIRNARKVIKVAKRPYNTPTHFPEEYPGDWIPVVVIPGFNRRRNLPPLDCFENE